jgi:hypothetical protein
VTAVAPDVATVGVISIARRTLSRIAGISGLAFVTLVTTHNLLLGAASMPASDASAVEIANFITTNKTLLSVAVALVPFSVVALFTFIAGATERLGRGSAEGAAWTRLGMTALTVVGPLFLTGLLFMYILLAESAELAARGALTETLWRLREGSFILVGIALAAGMIGLSRAARLNGLIPVWHQGLGFVAAAGFLIAAALAVPGLEGSPVRVLGFASFIGWLAWLALTSIRLLRSAD